MNIEEEIGIVKDFCNIKILYGRKLCLLEEQLMSYQRAIETLLIAYEKEKEKNNDVLGLIFEYGQTDGEHHKAWVIDQIVRIITENNYDKWVQHYEYDEETDEDYFWDVGIAP